MVVAAVQMGLMAEVGVLVAKVVLTVVIPESSETRYPGTPLGTKAKGERSLKSLRT